MPLDETATAPFARGRWLLSHNGVADRSILGPHPHAESACDSAQLAAHLFDFGPERAGEFVRDLGKRDPDARLNLLLSPRLRSGPSRSRPPPLLASQSARSVNHSDRCRGRGLLVSQMSMSGESRPMSSRQVSSMSSSLANSFVLLILPLSHSRNWPSLKS
jgi:hypothetical protein